MNEYKGAWLSKYKTSKITLYKCFSFNDYSVDALIKKGLYFNSPSKFNDPYDCNMDLVASKLTEYYKSQQEQIELIDKAKKKVQMLGICCFNPDWSNTLMWAHYADSFRGFCLGFEFDVKEVGASMGKRKKNRKA